MRPPATEKCGYYPTHEHVVEVIKTYIKLPEERSRLLDPCCGEGTAASMLGNALNCETWGTELSYKRAALAMNVLDKAYNCAWESAWITQEAVAFLFLNPPYDSDNIDHKGRLEYQFLKSCTPALAHGGLLCYIIPQLLLGSYDVAKRLATYYKDIKVGLYADSAYKQVVLFAIKRDAVHIPEVGEVEQIQCLATASIGNLEPVEAPVYSLLPAPVRGKAGQPIAFSRKDWSSEEQAEATLKSGVMQTSAWKDLLDPNRANVTQTIHPCMPLKKGHLAMLMASGMIGNIRIQDGDGKPMVIKGRVVKVQDSTITTDSNGDEVEKIKDRFVTTVTVVTQGGIAVIAEVEELTKFMQSHGDKVAQYILDSYRPRYNMNPTDKEIAILDTLGKSRKALPGQTESGLLPTQRHAAVAMARSIKANHVGNIQGEMGVGKTIIAAGTMSLLNSFPALIMCPPHLVPKWIREVEETIPGVKAFELRRVGQNSGDPHDVNDVRHFFDQYDAGLIGKKPVAVVATTSAKMSSGWNTAVVVRKVRSGNSNHWTTACCCPVCGAPVKDSEGYIIADPQGLSKTRTFCEEKTPGWELDEDGYRKLDKEGNPVWGERVCGNALFTFDETRRVSIAEYVSKHYRGRFKILVADECHQMKGKSSDRGVAFHQLVTACGSTLTLTGTFFGGKSTSIFWLLHRLNSSVRRDFKFDDETRWAKLYGVLEVTRKSKSTDDEDGYYTGNRRYRNTAKEQPGISPAIINRLLDTTVFLSLKDLGVELPEYKEEVAILDMDNVHGEQYRELDDSLKDLAKKNSRYLSTWLQWTLARPNSAFRDEKIVLDEYDENGEKTDRKIQFMELPAVVSESNNLPKEQWLSNFCLAERKLNRKVLVYLRQTGTRDIQDHVQTMLEKASLRVTVLHGSIDPRKREDWIAKRTPATDVLICNPKLVETGLDLIAYSTVVFAEIEFSLYTLWQSVRRVWRLGQVKPVKAVFSVYEGTMEARALQLMGKKMKAAQLLYGDEVGGAIVPEEDGDFLTRLARDVLSDVKMSDLQTLFAEDVKVSHGALGSLTVPSEVMTISLATWEEWIAQHGKQIVQSRHSRVKLVPQEQASLF